MENRDLSWLKFNERVLEEAFNENNPIGERLKFIAIFYSNLDEFYMVRIATLKLLTKKKDTLTGCSLGVVLKDISKYIKNLILKADYIYNHLITLEEVKNENFGLFKIDELTPKQLLAVDKYYSEVLEDEIKFKEKDVPKLTNKKLYLAFIDKDSKVSFASYSAKLNRMFEFEPNKFILIEDIIRYKLLKSDDDLGVGICSFRVVREANNSITYNDTDDIDKLTLNIMLQLEKRDKGTVSYVQIESLDNKAHKVVVDKIKKKLLLKNIDVQEFTHTPIETSFIFNFVEKLEQLNENLVYKKREPIEPVTFTKDESLFSQITKKDRVVFFPTESFNDSVLQLLKEACEDENVTEIFLTIYRIKKNSKLLQYLVQAAEVGKKINVIVEFKARFDEQHNIETANILKELNCNIYTTQHARKVHAKILMVKREVNNDVNYFSFLSTGNFHEGTAEIYTDLGIFTANKTIGQDIECFFYGVENQMATIPLSLLYASPKNLRTKICNLIEQEIVFHKLYGNGKIILKMNSLYNKEIIEKLLKASKIGVEIDIICRGICGIVPSSANTNNIRVVSLIGRYLEHSRIYYFNNNNNKKVYISSADLLDRNLNSRYELLTPILDLDIAEILYEYLILSLEDNTNRYISKENGTYVKVQSEDEKINVQMDLVNILNNHKNNFVDKS